jgi:DNA-binding LacI/PurR family transcriptional regulator
MSQQANAAARKRRAGGASLQEVPPTPAQPQSRVQQPPAGGLTLPQVISLVDKRLTTLETFMKESKADVSAPHADNQAASEDAVNALADEINHKFVMLAGEVENLKDIVLKLQAYTMEVNKTLYEERIHVLSDMGPEPKQGDNLVLELSEDE